MRGCSSTRSTSRLPPSSPSAERWARTSSRGSRRSGGRGAPRRSRPGGMSACSTRSPRSRGHQGQPRSRGVVRRMSITERIQELCDRLAGRASAGSRSSSRGAHAVRSGDHVPRPPRDDAAEDDARLPGRALAEIYIELSTLEAPPAGDVAAQTPAPNAEPPVADDVPPSPTRGKPTRPPRIPKSIGAKTGAGSRRATRTPRRGRRDSFRRQSRRRVRAAGDDRSCRAMSAART